MTANGAHQADPPSHEARGPYARGIETQDRIVRAVIDLARDAAGTLTLAEIAVRADVSDAGVLHHFGSRDNTVVTAQEVFRDAQQPTQSDTAASDFLTREIIRIACDPSSPARARASTLVRRTGDLGALLERAIGPDDA